MTSTQTVASPSGTGDTTGSGTWSYSYDGANRMTAATAPPVGAAPAVTTSYAYDGAGNRTSVTVGDGPAINSSFDAAGYQTTSGQTNYSHDEIGNLTAVDAAGTANDRCYFYDGFSNLHSANIGSTGPCSINTGDIFWAYDALDRPFQKDIGSHVAPTDSEVYLYQGMSQELVQKADSVGGSEYVVGPSGALAQRDTGQAADFLLKNMHGDVVGLADSVSGTVAGSQLYDPWGVPQNQSGRSSRLGFQGDATDPSTGLVDMGARLYDPGMGQFTTQDPLFGELSNPNTLNQFVYGGDNPVTMSDPTGLAGCDPNAGVKCSTVPPRGVQILDHGLPQGVLVALALC